MKSFLCACFCVFSLHAQVELPRPSPKATLAQQVGITQVTITYCRPGVKGREIWGKLVPYGQVWRTGANENTAISFDDSVRIHGNHVPAGTYGIHTIPGEKEWTIILSRDAKSWGSYSYKPENDHLRIKVISQAAPFHERLTFSFDDVTDRSAVVSVTWEKVRVSFTVEVDAVGSTLAKARKTLSWQPPYQAALFCIEQDVNLEEGQKWIDVSLAIEVNYYNTAVKARYLERNGKLADAVAMMEKAMELAARMPNPPFNKTAMDALLTEWKSRKGKK